MIVNISMQEWESKTVLEQHLLNSHKQILVVGLDIEAPRKYYSFKLVRTLGITEIGVISSGLGIKPSIIVSETGDTIIVGHDMWITGIDENRCIIKFHKKLDGVFFDFANYADKVVVIHELGALEIDYNGNEKWSVATDVVMDFQIAGNKELYLKMMADESIVSIDLLSGRYDKLDKE